MTRNASVGVRMETELKEAAEKAAEKNRWTLSSLMEVALIEYLENHKHIKKGKF